MGDFLGFTFGGVHSSDLGITRVSGGDRYEEKLQPEITDRTTEVPGLDGVYYFGSDHKERTFDISIGFDSLTEMQFRQLRTFFSTKEIKDLIFDELPYKKYKAKLQGPVELSFVCFDEPQLVNTTVEGIRYKTSEDTYDNTHIVKRSSGNRERIYKGEGKLTFICYYPYAQSVFKQLPEEGGEWAFSSGILSATNYSEFDTYDNTSGIIKIYNCGDLPANFSLYCPFAASHSMKLKYYISDGNLGGELDVNAITALDNSTGSNDIGFLINSNNGLIQGVQSIDYAADGVTYVTSKNFYNKYIKSGSFFRIEPNMNTTGEDVSYFEITDISDNVIDSGTVEITETIEEESVVVATYSKIQVFYDYLYY